MKTEKVSGSKAHIRYRLQDGTLVPGVTTVLGILDKPALGPWHNRMGLQGINTRKYVDALAEAGTAGHYLTECYDLAVDADMSRYSPETVDKAENVFLKYLDWCKGKDIEIDKVEWPLVSEEWHFGGTIDRYAKIDGEWTLLDIKTSKAIYPEHAYQVVAYRQLVYEQSLPVDAVRILQIGRTDEEGFSERIIRSADEIESYWEIFAACLTIYQERKRKF